jgi:hypothetical protein
MINNNIIAEQAKIATPLNIQRIADISGDTIYLQSRTPGLIYFTKDLQTFDSIKINLPEMPVLENAFITSIDYPKQFIIGYNAKKVAVVDCITGEYKLFDTNTPGPVNNAIYLGNYQYMLKSIDTTNLNCLFYKIDLLNKTIVKENNLSKSLGDAGFIHDGLLLYDNKYKLFTYTEYYSNNIVTFDTTLRSLNRYHTIDTFNSSGMHVKISATGVINDLPPRNTNGAGGLDNGILYVRSYVIADNDQAPEKEIRIDRYSLENGTYLNSFYLPNPREDKLINFTVKDGYLYALFKEHLSKMKIKSI